LRQQIRLGGIHGGTRLRARVAEHRGQTIYSPRRRDWRQLLREIGGRGRKGSTVSYYDYFVDGANQADAKLVAARSMSSGDFAKVVYDAATDGADRLRYLVGDDSRGFIRAKQEMSDQYYVEFMRSQFS